MSEPVENSDWINLAGEEHGALVVWSSDDYFASADNLLKRAPAVFLPEEFTPRGKWMDGWESRRKRVPGHDSAVIRLGLPGKIHEIVVDTAFFRGNFPKACSIEVASVPEKTATAEVLADDSIWQPLVPVSDLQGDFKNRFVVASELRATHLRLHIYPDGGVARLRVYGEVLPEPRVLGRPDVEQDLDLVSLEHGGRVIAANDMFFGSRNNLLGLGRAANMGDGWETKRSRKEAPDWVIAQLGVPGTVHEVEIDTQHFRGNFPESAGLYGVNRPGASVQDIVALREDEWQPLLARTQLEEHRRHRYDSELLPIGDVTHVKMHIWPDGGVSRLRLRGAPSLAGREWVGLRYLNSLGEKARAALYLGACASAAFAEQLAARGAFTSFAQLTAAAAEVWAGLSLPDWEQAFAAHPRIGEKAGHDRQAAGEQAKVASAADEVKAKLAEINRAYEAKFGRIYLVCASGKSAEELLAIAEQRLGRSKDEELAQMVEEQRKITELRLARALGRSAAILGGGQ